MDLQRVDRLPDHSLLRSPMTLGRRRSGLRWDQRFGCRFSAGWLVIGRVEAARSLPGILGRWDCRLALFGLLWGLRSRVHCRVEPVVVSSQFWFLDAENWRGLGGCPWLAAAAEGSGLERRMLR